MIFKLQITFSSRREKYLKHQFIFIYNSTHLKDRQELQDSKKLAWNSF